MSEKHVAYFDQRAYDSLSANLTSLVEWRAQDPRGAVYAHPAGEIWAHIPGGHKWLNYFSIYEDEFAHLRNTPCRVLEIGIYKGASLALWKAYFGQSSTIVGVDIDPACSGYAKPEANVHVRIGSQADGDFLREVVDEFGPFDLIIDDGSHHSSHQIASFNALFDGGLAAQGRYFVEDLECVYWGHQTGQLDQAVSSVDFFKMLIDMQHHVFRHGHYDQFALHVPGHLDGVRVEKISTLLKCIRFYRGCASVHKGTVPFPQVLHI